jgi:hypothetical protein
LGKRRFEADTIKNPSERIRRGTSIVNEFAITYWREGCIVLYERREGKVFGRIINKEHFSCN